MFISCEETKELIKEKNAQFIDVRTLPEFMSLQLPDAVNIPLDQIGQVAETQLDKSRPIIVFCRSGSRSSMAMQILQSMGFTDVHNMGSYSVWQ